MPHASQARASMQSRPDWPDAVLSRDPETMHPRAVEMAQAMREGSGTFRDLVAAGFTVAEITEFNREAKALATTLSARQMSPGADRLSELAEKARAAIENRPPMPKGATETQPLLVAWSAYCRAIAAYKLDRWPAQRERCLKQLEAFFRQTPAGPAVTRHVVCAVDETLTRIQ